MRYAYACPDEQSRSVDVQPNVFQITSVIHWGIQNNTMVQV